jgi:glycosyltransferase involved in cell wall biosynthesis
MVVKPTENKYKPINIDAKGTHKNIHYKYIGNETIWPQESSKFYKLYLILRAYWLLFFALLNTTPKSVLLISNNYVLIRLVLLFSVIVKFNVFQEKSELPPVIKKKISGKYSKKYLRIYPKFSGIIVMTQFLEKYFKDIGQKRIFHLPMSIDFNRFSNVKRERNNSIFTFKYCGGGNYERDGLLLIVKGLIKFYRTNRNFEFHIIGPINKSSEYFKKILNIIKREDANRFIKFLGKKKSAEIPEILQNADCLIMAPPKNFDSGGFPTKLGEYLATGIPVICTSVGEIPRYLNDRNSILIKPNSMEDIMKAAMEVCLNYDKYIEIGEKGRKTAFKHFNPENYTEELIKFLEV